MRTYAILASSLFIDERMKLGREEKLQSIDIVATQSCSRSIMKLLEVGYGINALAASEEDIPEEFDALDWSAEGTKKYPLSYSLYINELRYLMNIGVTFYTDSSKTKKFTLEDLKC